MSRCEKSVGSGVYRRSAWRDLVLLSTAVVLVSACGSDDKGSSSEMTVAVAGAQENAVASGGVCYSWPNGTTDAQPCAVGLKGPGGGRVFYDAGSEQPWGRFLEVAPQTWGKTQYDCSGLAVFNRLTSGCGRDKSLGVPDVSSDIRSSDPSGWTPCENDVPVLLPGEAGNTLWEIGGGRRNTEVLSKTAECVDGTFSALTLATGYRGGGLSDWYLPSGGELTELCKYTGRDAIGGFGNWEYMSSTTGPKIGLTNFYTVSFEGDPASCSRGDALHEPQDGYQSYYENHSVRPIRAFNGSI